MKKIFSLALVLALVLGSAPLPVLAQTTDRAALLQRISQLLELINTLKAQIAAIRGGTGSTSDVRATINSLIATLKQGDQNASVSRLQALLNQTIGAGLPVTGYYGPMTSAAVTKYKTQSGTASGTGFSASVYASTSASPVTTLPTNLSSLNLSQFDDINDLVVSLAGTTTPIATAELRALLGELETFGADIDDISDDYTTLGAFVSAVNQVGGTKNVRELFTEFRLLGGDFSDIKSDYGGLKEFFTDLNSKFGDRDLVYLVNLLRDLRSMGADWEDLVIDSGFGSLEELLANLSEQNDLAGLEAVMDELNQLEITYEQLLEDFEDLEDSLNTFGQYGDGTYGNPNGYNYNTGYGRGGSPYGGSGGFGSYFPGSNTGYGGRNGKSSLGDMSQIFAAMRRGGAGPEIVTGGRPPIKQVLEDPKMQKASLPDLAPEAANDPAKLAAAAAEDGIPDAVADLPMPVRPGETGEAGEMIDWGTVKTTGQFEGVVLSRRNCFLDGKSPNIFDLLHFKVKPSASGTSEVLSVFYSPKSIEKDAILPGLPGNPSYPATRLGTLTNQGAVPSGGAGISGGVNSGEGAESSKLIDVGSIRAGDYLSGQYFQSKIKISCAPEGVSPGFSTPTESLDSNLLAVILSHKKSQNSGAGSLQALGFNLALPDHQKSFLDTMNGEELVNFTNDVQQTFIKNSLKISQPSLYPGFTPSLDYSDVTVTGASASAISYRLPGSTLVNSFLR